MAKINLVLVVCAAALAPRLSAAALSMSEHHLYVIQSGVDEIKGSYLFLVTNHDSTPQKGHFKVILPEETKDWRPLEGVSGDDLSLGEGDGLVLDKTFTPGENLISIGFIAPAERGEARVSIPTDASIKSLSFLIDGKTLNFRSLGGGYEQKKGVNLGHGVLDSYTKTDIAAGSREVIVISGVREGRALYYLVGSVAGLVTLVVAAWLFFRTKPRESAVA